jgi:nicotinamide mononucleotide transporter
MTWTTIAAWLAAHGLELAGVVTTIIGIWLTTKRLLICWPITLLADVLYLVIFFQSGLFSDALLQVFFVAFTIYGWWHWWRGVRADGEVRVEPLGTQAGIVALVVGAIGSLLLGRVMLWLGGILHITVALPHMDAVLTSYSLVASWWGKRVSTLPTGGSGLWWIWSISASTSTRISGSRRCSMQVSSVSPFSACATGTAPRLQRSAWHWICSADLQIGCRVGLQAHAWRLAAWAPPKRPFWRAALSRRAIPG